MDMKKVMLIFLSSSLMMMSNLMMMSYKVLYCIKLKMVLFGIIFVSSSAVELLTFKLSNGMMSTGFEGGFLSIMLINNLINSINY